MVGIALALPSDFTNDENHFLTFNGMDDAKSACKYYKAIPAIFPQQMVVNGETVTIEKDCDSDPELKASEVLTFDQWKEFSGLRPFNSDDDAEEVSALYFNSVDLNLARSMHGKTSVVRGEKRTAYYVCNYNSLEEARRDPDNRNAVACVAFDYTETDPYTKFFVFKKDPESGIFRLFASANLDQKGEKFVPGLCKACHGGDKQPQQQFTGDDPDIGAHFLPFDLDNFDYLEDSAFSRRAQEGKFKQLNQMIVDDTNPAPVVKQLIEGWYRNNRSEQDSEFIPLGWEGHEQLYRRVVKPSCRTCHVALSEKFNFNRFANLVTDDPATPADDTKGSFKDQLRVNDNINAGLIQTRVCETRNMPNSKVTFDLFWLNREQGAVLARFLRDAFRNPSIACPPP